MVGLVAVGIEILQGNFVPKVIMLYFTGSTLKQEKRNQAMNWFTAEVVDRMYKKGLHPLQEKGQRLAE